MDKKEDVVIFVLLVASLVSSIYGVCLTFPNVKNNWIHLVYGWAYFVLAALTCFLGVTALGIEFAKLQDYYAVGKEVLRKHFLFCWLSVVAGYPMLTGLMFTVYYPHFIDYVLLALALIPIACYLGAKITVVKGVTEVVSWIVVAANVYICVLTHNNWGLVGAAAMASNTICLIIPTQNSFLSLSSINAFILGTGVASYCLGRAVQEMYKNPVVVQDIFPFLKK